MSKTNKERRWVVPNKRASNYADERKAKVHQRGPKEGQELTDFEAGVRTGYLQCQNDHAGIYKFKRLLAKENPFKKLEKFQKKLEVKRNNVR